MTFLSTLRTLRDVDVALALSNLCAYHIAFDRWDDARLHAREALLAAREARHYADLGRMLEHLGTIAALAPEPEPQRAAERRAESALLLGYADCYAARVGAQRAPIDQQERERAMNVLRRETGADRLASLLACGAAMNLNEAILLALAV
jgi:hypothetical protein